jgi:hypothetical protein
LLTEGGGSKEENSHDFCPNYVQKYGLWTVPFHVFSVVGETYSTQAAIVYRTSRTKGKSIATLPRLARGKVRGSTVLYRDGILKGLDIPSASAEMLNCKLLSTELEQHLF